ncbi:MAG: DUF951 domain-containing protein [Oscillospiraceae bacterium]|nr:DUF951 domain-containing protein [Oscillospiraceae bacterium]
MTCIKVGDRVEMKKAHPCGSKVWEILRVGADIKIKCLGCDRLVIVPRSKFEQIAKKIV